MLNISTLRAKSGTLGKLFVLSPRLVFRARLDQDHAYPVSELSFDTVISGDIDDVKAEMLVCFESEAGRYDRGFSRVRAIDDGSVVTDGNLIIGQCSRGTKRGEANALNDTVVSVYELYVPFAKIPTITEDGVLFKDFNLTYPGYTKLFPPAVNASCGAIVKAGESHQLFCSAKAIGTGNSITSYAWDLVDATPSSSSSQNPTVTFPEGFRYVECSVSDTFGNVQRVKIPVLATGSTNVFYTAFSLNGLTESVHSGKVQLEIFAGKTDFMPFALVMYKEDEYLSDSQEYAYTENGTENIRLIGWLGDSQISVKGTQNGSLTRVSLNINTLADMLDSLPGFGNVLRNSLSLNSWFDANAPDIEKFVHHILKWSTNVLDIAPFYFEDIAKNYDFTILSVNAQSVLKQCDSRSQSCGLRLTCDLKSRLRLIEDKLLRNDRSFDVVATLSSEDVLAIERTRTQSTRLSWHRGNAVQVSTQYSEGYIANQFFVVSPGLVPGQGVNTYQQGEQLVVDEEELMIREGNRYASRTNAEQGSIRVVIAHNSDSGIRFGDWIALDSSVTDETDFDYTANLYCVTEKSVELKGSSRLTTLVCEIGFLGFPAESDPQPADDDPSEDDPITDPSETETIPPDEPPFSLPSGDWFRGDEEPYDPAVTMPIGPTPTSTRLRGKIFFVTHDKKIVRLTWSKFGMPTFEDISPTGIAKKSLLGNAIRICISPWNYKAAYVRSTLGLVISTQDITATVVKWTVIDRGQKWKRTYIFDNDEPSVGWNPAYFPYYFPHYGSEYFTKGVFTAGQGYVFQDQGFGVDSIKGGTIGIEFPFATRVDSLTARFDAVRGGGSVFESAVYLNENPPSPSGEAPGFAGTLVHYTFSQPEGVNQSVKYIGDPAYCRYVYLKFHVGTCDWFCPPGGSGTIREITLEGQSGDPFMGVSPGTVVSDFQPIVNKKNSFAWLTVKDGFVWFARTFDSFRTIKLCKIAEYSTSIVPSFTISPYDWRRILVVAGNPASANAFVYQSLNGGSSFVKTAVAISDNGGPIWWNSRSESNKKNMTDKNVMVLEGLDGSSNQQFGIGIRPHTTYALSGDDHPFGPLSLGAMTADIKYVYFVANDGKTFSSTDKGATWTYVGDCPTSADVRGFWQWPTDKNFLLAWGDHCLAYSKDAGATWTDLWSYYEAWRSATFDVGEGTIVTNAVLDLSTKYISQVY